jgi:hypothetical protein
MAESFRRDRSAACQGRAQAGLSPGKEIAMIRKPLTALALMLAASLTTSCVHVEVMTGPTGRTSAMAGIWEGTGVQSPVGLTAETWKVRMAVNARGEGAVSYPGLECGGVLTRVRSHGHSVEYREVITSGVDNCVNGSTVTVIPAKGLLFVYWTGEGSDDPEVNASAVLLRVGD